MYKSGASLFYFGIYLLVVGFLFLLIPAKLIEILKLPEIPVGWARIIGLLAIVIGLYDTLNGKLQNNALIKASVWIRVLFTTGVVILVLTKQTTMAVLPLALLDTVGAIWTYLALRADARAGKT